MVHVNLVYFFAQSQPALKYLPLLNTELTALKSAPTGSSEIFSFFKVQGTGTNALN